jgi:hypothetical protein
MNQLTEEVYESIKESKEEEIYKSKFRDTLAFEVAEVTHESSKAKPQDAEKLEFLERKCVLIRGFIRLYSQSIKKEEKNQIEAKLRLMLAEAIIDGDKKSIALILGSKIFTPFTIMKAISSTKRSQAIFSDEPGKSLVYLAVEAGQYEIVEFLINEMQAPVCCRQAEVLYLNPEICRAFDPAIKAAVLANDRRILDLLLNAITGDPKIQRCITENAYYIPDGFFDAPEKFMLFSPTRNLFEYGPLAIAALQKKPQAIQSLLKAGFNLFRAIESLYNDFLDYNKYLESYTAEDRVNAIRYLVNFSMLAQTPISPEKITAIKEHILPRINIPNGLLIGFLDQTLSLEKGIPDLVSVLDADPAYSELILENIDLAVDIALAKGKKIPQSSNVAPKSSATIKGFFQQATANPEKLTEIRADSAPKETMYER